MLLLVLGERCAMQESKPMSTPCGDIGPGTVWFSAMPTRLSRPFGLLPVQRERDKVENASKLFERGRLREKQKVVRARE